MKLKLKQLLILSIGFLILFATSGFDLISDEYLSPEHIYIDKNGETVYIGLSTYPGVAEFDVESAKIVRVIPMPSPVSGVVVDETKNLLYAGSRGNSGKLFVYDLNNEKAVKSINIGHGPEGMEISKEAGLLFVANSYSSDISVIDLKNQTEIERIDVVREPVSLAVSPDGSTVAVANLLPSQPSTGKYISAAVTLIDIGSKSVIKNVELPNGAFALKDILFSKDGKYIYVTHLTGRYNVLTNQIEKGWINTNAISVLDAESKELYTTVLLDDIYKGAANPCGLDISEDGKKLFAAISGTHELFVVDRQGMHKLIDSTKGISQTSQTTTAVSGAENNIQLFEKHGKIEPIEVLFKDIPNELSFLTPVRKRVKLNGKGPAYIVSSGNNVFITSYFSDGIEIVNTGDVNIGAKFVNIGSKDIALSAARYGELLFHNAENCFQQWQSCASCHPGKGRADGLNWDLMNDGIGNPKNTKSLLYAHVTPPAMITGIRENAEIGVRAGFKYIQFFNTPESDAEAVDEYLKSLRPVVSPYLIDGKLSKSAISGKKIFEERNCNGCHSGPYFTDMQQYEMGEKGKYDKQNRWDTPTLMEIWRTAPYLHNGKHNSLEDVFKIEKHGIYEPISDREVKDLTEYLLSL
jgi:YVTN family beta-propeller protein